jgi:hypothetical protein
MMNLFKQIYQKVLLLFYDLGKKLQAGCYACDGVLREEREVVSLLIGGKGGSARPAARRARGTPKLVKIGYSSTKILFTLDGIFTKHS